uniref:Copia protein n=1 Tax=Tanacetum cinerariifolium TaxID=118510 RepID=A0A6L2N3V3_TANCI|nr:copia protein [Tanacetum cinerariifolium]
MESLNPLVVAAAKLPILNHIEFDLWKMRIEQYFLMTNYSLWEVILNGDSPPPTRIVDGVVQVVAPTTAEQRLAKKNELKARGTFLMALPDKHQLKFNIHKDVKSLMEATEKRYGVTVAPNIFAASSKAKVSSLPNVDSFSDVVIYSFFASQSNSPQLDDEDLKQINLDDLEEIDLKWQMAILIKRARRECRSPRDNRNKETSRRTIPAEVSTSNALVSQCDAVSRYDWSFQADEDPTNYALMAYTSSGSSSSSGLDNENEAVFEEDIKLLKFDVMLRDNALAELRKKFENFEKERNDLKLTLDKFQTLSKNLSKLLESQVSDKIGLGFDSHVFNCQVFECEDLHSHESNNRVPKNPENHRSKTGKGYHAVLPLYTGTFLPPKPDLVFNDDTNANETEIESVPKQREPSFVASTDHVKSSRESFKKVEHHKQATNLKTNNQKYRGHNKNWNNKACLIYRSLNHLIKDCNYYEKQMVQKPMWNSAMRVSHQNSVRLTHPHSNRNVVPTTVLSRSRLVSLNAVIHVPTGVTQSPMKSTWLVKYVVNKAHSPGNPQHALKDKGVNDSICSRHMTINISFLSDFKEINEGYVTFGENPKGDSECVVLSSDYTLPDENHVLLRVPREKNMYNVDLKNVVPSGGNQPNDNVDPHNTDDDVADAAFDVKENENDVYVSANGSDKTANQKHDEKAKRNDKGKSHVDSLIGVRDLRADFEEFSFNSSNMVNVVSAPVNDDGPNSTSSSNSFNTASPYVNVVCLNFEIARKSSFVDPSKYPDDPDMPELEDIVYSNYEKDVGVEVDIYNLEIIYLSVLFQLPESTKIILLIKSLVTWIQLLKQGVWVLVDLPKGKRVVDSKWVFKNKKDERGIIVENKARFVVQGHTQEEGIDYDEVFALVARIEAIRLFLAYAFFMGFMVYQMDVKSSFLYGTIEEEDKFQMSSMRELTFFFGLQVKQKVNGKFISQDKYVAEILNKCVFIDVKSASTPIETEKPLFKCPDGEDVDVWLIDAKVSTAVSTLVLIATQHLSNESSLLGVSTPRCDKDSIELKELMVFMVVVSKAIIRRDLYLDDADGVECLPNAEIFEELARIGYEKPPLKLTIYKAFFSVQWKFLIHTLVYMVRNVDSLSMFLMYPLFLQVVMDHQVDDMTTHNTRYTSLTLTQKVFANLRRVRKGLSGVETPLFDSMLDPTPTPHATSPQDEPLTPYDSPPQDQPTTPHESSMPLLTTLIETCATLSQKVVELEKDKYSQALEILQLKKRVKKLEMKKKLKYLGLKRGRLNQEDVNASSKGVSDVSTLELVSAAEPTVFDDEDFTMTMAQTLIKLKAEKAKILDEQIAQKLHDEEVQKAAAKDKQERADMERVLKLQRYYDDKEEKIDWSVVVEQVKYPIIDWEIDTEGSRIYWKIIRVGGITEAYQNSEDMLKQFDREDLVALWNLVKEKFSSAVPSEDKERALWIELKRLFEPDAYDVLWELQRYMHAPLTWKLYTDCGVNHLSLTRGHDIFMLTEKDYPLLNAVMILMLSGKLQVEKDNEMARVLVMKIFMEANKPKSKSLDTSSYDQDV